MSLIEEEFKDKVINRSGINLLNAINAIILIRRCKELKIDILGIDTFIITKNKTQPLLEKSIDYSSPYSEIKKQDVWENAIEFINKLSDAGYMFEIVYE